MIDINGLTKKIRGSLVLQDINLTIEPGVITGLSGINGSGKTMLLRVIAGLIKPTSGSVSIDGLQLWKDISFPKSIGVLIEGPAFIDTYSGFDNLELIASINKRIDSQGITTMLQKVGLDPHDKKKYRKYSLGMKQRLGIAAALMEHPDIVLLDEPTNALDAKGVDLLKELVQEAKRQGSTVVLTCHDRTILQELADVVYFMESGRILGGETMSKGAAVDE